MASYFIPVFDDLPNHPKTRRLMRSLGLSKVSTLGHLLLFWLWSSSYTKDGDLSPLLVEEIEEGALWKGTPGAFVEGLLEVGFVDTNMVIHDWQTGGGRLEKARKENAEKQARFREKKKLKAAEDAEKKKRKKVTVTSRLRHRDITAREEKIREDQKREEIPTAVPAAAKKKAAKKNNPDQLPLMALVPQHPQMDLLMASFRRVTERPDKALPAHKVRALKSLCDALAMAPVDAAARIDAWAAGYIRKGQKPPVIGSPSYFQVVLAAPATPAPVESSMKSLSDQGYFDAAN